MEAGKDLPAYYRDRYVRWYRWFSRVYDPFVGLMLSIANGGFGGERRLRGLVVDRLDLHPGDRVIDICSGTGTLSIMLGERLQNSGEVVGIEISRHQMAIARRKSLPPNVTLTRGDAQVLPHADSYFDRAVIFGALHEVPREVRKNILAQAYRVLKPGGRMVVLEHNRPAGRWRAWFYKQLERLNPEYPTYCDLLESGLTNELGEAGFLVAGTEVVAAEVFELAVAEKP